MPQSDFQLVNTLAIREKSSQSFVLK